MAAITSHYDPPLYPTEVPVARLEGGMRTDSVVLLNQIRSVDKQRLVRRLGKLKPEIMRKVDIAVQISLGLIAV